MALFYLIRHGEPDYSMLSEAGFWGFGQAFAPLSGLGIQQAETAAADERLKAAELIVSSPYTRALQTAAIISRETGLPVTVEVDLHEWIPDKTNQNRTSEDADRLYAEFMKHRGVYPKGEQMRWETVEEMRTRMHRAADKYADYQKVIFVGHGMAFRSLTYIERMKPADIVEWEYTIGKEQCPYSFC